MDDRVVTSTLCELSVVSESLLGRCASEVLCVRLVIVGSVLWSVDSGSDTQRLVCGWYIWHSVRLTAPRHK